jgi:DNA invertase Pin-like site-specific DNA recombinase
MLSKSTVCVTEFGVMIVLRTSTEQTTGHQRTRAEQAGFKIDKVVADEGMRGVSTRLVERPEGKRFFDMLRAGDTLVVRCVDRLGRNCTDLVDTIREFMRRGVIIRTAINGMTFDRSTTEPMQHGRPPCAHRRHGSHRPGPSQGHQIRSTGRH